MKQIEPKNLKNYEIIATLIDGYNDIWYVNANSKREASYQARRIAYDEGCVIKSMKILQVGGE